MDLKKFTKIAGDFGDAVTKAGREAIEETKSHVVRLSPLEAIKFGDQNSYEMRLNKLRGDLTELGKTPDDIMTFGDFEIEGPHADELALLCGAFSQEICDHYAELVRQQRPQPVEGGDGQVGSADVT